MSNFFKILLGSCLGTAIALIAMFFIGFSAIVGLASSGEQKPKVEANSILTLDLASVPELTGNAPLDGGFGLAFDTDEVVGLHDVVRSIEKAKTDDNIKGIYLSSMTNGVAYTSLRTVRQALEDFRESGKFVVSYAPLYEQRAYYLASAADEVYMGPLGAVDFRGIGAEIPFYKNMLDKVGIKFEIFYAGDFKSATEPFRRTEISENNRIQTRQYLEGLMKYMLQDIGASRNIDPAQLRTYADEITGWKDQAAVDAGLIDGIKRRTEVDARLHELVGFEMDQKLKTIDLQAYFEARMKKLKGGGSSEVAVLIAEGSIVDGKGDLGAIGDKKYVDEIERLTEDDDIKAVVLRVNSGGGSASSSENIWYAAEQLKAAGKPFVVSMGDYAASGGYYVAAGADSIFAEPTTITGSIGVFMMFPIVKEMMNDKIGINFDTVNTTRNSNAFSTFRGLGDEERVILKARTEMIYNTFLQRVADGRGIPFKTVEEIARGRVYTGERAIEIGLVDRLGGLDAAIRSAANLASLETDDYSVGHYPKIKPPLEQLIEDLLGEDATKGFGNAALKDQLGEENYEYFKFLRETTRAQGAQARMTEMVKF